VREASVGLLRRPDEQAWFIWKVKYERLKITSCGRPAAGTGEYVREAETEY
jgi:hypothetical protein